MFEILPRSYSLLAEVVKCKVYKVFQTKGSLKSRALTKHFSSQCSLLIPLETPENQKVFWCFQEDEKGILGRKGLRLTSSKLETLVGGSHWYQSKWIRFKKTYASFQLFHKINLPKKVESFQELMLFEVLSC